MYQFSYYFLWFLICSILGWMCEVTCCSMNERRFVYNRGFLVGPYCPVFGVGSLLMVFFLGRYQKDPVALFVMGAVICTILEYLTSYIMEKMFKTRWWDYYDHHFNIQGRVCLDVSLCFGVAGWVVIYLLLPLYQSLISKISHALLIGIALTLFIFFLADVIFSYIVIFKLQKNVQLINKKDATKEIKQEVDRYIDHYRIFISRLLKSFPKAKIYHSRDLIEKLKVIVANRKKRHQKKS